MIDRLKLAVQAATARLNQDWQDGTLAWCREHKPDLYREVRQRESRMEDVWRDVLAGREDASLFYRLLGEWEQLHRRMMRECER